MEVLEEISRRGFGTQNNFTLHCFLHFELNSYKQISNLNKAVAQRDPTALHDSIMKKNVPGQLSPMRPTETIPQPEHFYFLCRKDTKGQCEQQPCFNSVVPTVTFLL